MKRKTILLIFISAILFLSGLTVSAATPGLSLQQRFDNDDYELFDAVTINYYNPAGEKIDNPSINSTLKINFDWSITDDLFDLIQTGDYFEYTLPDKFKITEAVNDVAMWDGITYSITTDNKIRVNFVGPLVKLSDIHGGLKLEAKLDEGSIVSPGEIEIVFPLKEDQEVTLDLKPKSNEVAISKQGTPNQLVNTKSIKWAILVNGNLQNLTDVTIKDLLPNTLEAEISSFTIKYAKVNFDGNLIESEELVPSEFYVFNPSDLSYTMANLNRAVLIEFNSIVKDDQLSAGVISSQKFENFAELRFNDNKTIMGSASVISSYKGMTEKKRVSIDQNTRTIEWQITVNGRQKTLNNPEVVDEYDEKLVYLDNTLQVLKADGTPLESSKYIADTSKESEINVKFIGDINDTYTIKYKTKLKDTVDVAANVTVNNTVLFAGEEADGSGEFTQQVVDKNVGSSGINYTNRTIPWEILINKNNDTISNLELTDTYDFEGLKLVEADFKIVNVDTGAVLVEGDDYTFEITTKSGNTSIQTGFKVNFINNYDSVTNKLKITYTTKFDYDLLTKTGSNYENGQYYFRNTASLSWVSKNNKKYTSVDSAKQLVNKSTIHNGSKDGQYNAVNKQIKWTINLNYNAEEYTTPALEDVILGGQTFLKDSFEIWSYNVKANGDIDLQEKMNLDDFDIDYPTESNDFTLRIELPVGTFQMYQVVYNTEITEKIVSKHYDNVAKFYNGDITRSLEARVEVKYGESIISKSGVQNKDYIDWSIVINHSQSTLENVVILDTPSVNQVLLKSSFVLYPVVMKADESYVVDREHPKALNDFYTLTFGENADGINVFSLAFNQEIKETYVLEYRSQIYTTEDNLNITNRVELTGNKVTYKPSEEIQVIKVKTSETNGWAVGKKASFKLLKTGVNGVPLEGVTFELYNENNVLIATKVTDENGYIQFTDLLRGDYKLKEVKTVKGYVIPDSYFQGIAIVVSAATSESTYEFKVENVQNQLEVIKENSQGGKLNDAVFSIEMLGEDGYSLIASGLRTVQGKFVYAGLSVGTYRLIETEAPDGYILNTEPLVFEITADSNGQAVNKSITVVNEKGSARIHKTNENNQPLEGVYFDLYQGENLISENLITDDQGNATVTGLAPGSYAWIEKSSVNGYIVNSTPQAFEISNTSEGAVETVVTEMVNYKASIKFAKVDENNQPLAGTIFNLVNSSKQVIATATSDAQGIVTFENVVPGDYTIVEEQATRGYVRSTIVQTVSVALSSIETQVEIDLGVVVNGQGSVSLTKYNDLNKVLEGVVFSLSGSELTEPVLYTTNAEGLIYVDGLAPGNYQFVEVSAPEGYIVDPNPIPFTIADSSEGVPSTIQLSTINNKAHLYFMKENANGNPLADSVFGLYTADNNILVQEATSDINGMVNFYRVGSGDYVIREINASNNYVLNTQELTVNVPVSSETAVELDLGTFVNYQGSVKLVKTNDEHIVLSGVVYELFDGNNHSLGQYTTDAQGEIFVTDLASGEYYFVEVSSVDGYVVDTTNIRFTIVDEYEGEPATVELTLTNSRGEILLHKTDAEGDFLSGAYFGLFAAGESEPLQVTPSDQNGLVRFQKVSVGQYEVREITALNTYILNTERLIAEVPVSSDEVVSIDLGSFVNYQGKVIVRKVDPQGNLLKEAVFDLFEEESGRWVRNLSTQDAILTLDHLSSGNYQLFEVEAPSGYRRLQTPVKFTIEAEAEGAVEVQEIAVENTPVSKFVNTGVGINPWPLLVSVLGVISIWLGVFLKHLQKKNPRQS